MGGVERARADRAGRRGRPFLRPVLALLLAVPALVVGGVAGTAQATPSSTTAHTVAARGSTVKTAVSNYGACLAGGGKGDFLVLIDDSGSLKQSDSANARVTAAKYLVDQLASFASTSGSSIAVKVSAFSTTYRSVSAWTTVNASGARSVDSSIDGLATANTGFETDYWSALEGARKDLAQRASARGEAASCQAVAWFTDGKMDYDVRSTDALVKAYGTTKPFAPGADMTTAAGVATVKKDAQNQLCRSGGLADQLRSSDVTMFAIGLESSSASADDFGLLNAIATGSDTETSTKCGTIAKPVGAFETASDISDLLFAFDAISTPGQAPIQQQSGICQGTYCTDQFHRYVLDTSISRVHILASADIAKVDVDLVGPTGSPVALPNKGTGTQSSVTVAGAKVAYTWQSDNTIEIDQTQAGGSSGWTGLWKLVFIDPTSSSAGKTSRSNIHISSDYKPAWSEKSTAVVHSGETLPGTFGIVDGSGEAVAGSSILGAATLSATLVDSTGKQLVLASGLDKTSIPSKSTTTVQELATGAATLKLTLDLTTADATAPDGSTVAGTQLEPAEVSVPITIRPPSQYPVVANRIDFGVVDGKTEATANVSVTGSGCAWLPAAKPSIAASPSDVGAVAVTSSAATKSDCVSGGSSLPVKLAFDRADNGSINGTITVDLAPKAGDDKVLTTTVAFTADVRKPLNQTNFLLTLIVALLLGPGIPLGLLYLAKWYASRIPAAPLSSQRIPVEVVDGIVRRDGERFALRETDLRDLRSIRPGGERSLDVAGLRLAVKRGASPFGVGHVVATSLGEVSASDQVPSSDTTGTSALLPLAVHNHWVVVWTPGSRPDDATVVLLVSGDADADRKRKLVDDINDRLPGVLAGLVHRTGGPVTPTGTGGAFGVSAPTTTDEGFGFGFDDPGDRR